MMQFKFSEWQQAGGETLEKYLKHEIIIKA